jgi:hypothetical protein
MRFTERLAELLCGFHNVVLQAILQATVPDVFLKFLQEAIILGGAVVNSQSLTQFELLSLGVGVIAARPSFNVLDDMHGEELVLEAVGDLNEVL